MLSRPFLPVTSPNILMIHPTMNNLNWRWRWHTIIVKEERQKVPMVEMMKRRRFLLEEAEVEDADAAVVVVVDAAEAKVAVLVDVVPVVVVITVDNVAVEEAKQAMKRSRVVAASTAMNPAIMCVTVPTWGSALLLMSRAVAKRRSAES
jgi:hypothetical protein